MKTKRITLKEGLQDLIDVRRVIAGASVAFGTAGESESLVHGNAQEVVLHDGQLLPDAAALRRDSIFDLASLTKLFTALSILLLRQDGRVRFDDPVKRFDKRFVNIPDVTVGELMIFHPGLRTSRRIDGLSNRREALDTLFSIQRAPLDPAGKIYTDMGAMILKYVIEAAGGEPYFDFLKRRILDPLGMRNTFSFLPASVGHRLVNYNYERRIVNGEYRLDTACPPGTVNDQKARILCDAGRDLCGHAGLFSTLTDMVRFSQGLLNGALVPIDTVREMGTNRTGVRLPDGRYTHHFGYLCYAKHPDQTYSEVPACFGSHTVASNGYTGNHLSVDPERGMFMVILANKTHNRITWLTGRANPFETTTEAAWNDGHTYPVSQNYTFLKDTYIKEPIAELLKGFEAAD